MFEMIHTDLNFERMASLQQHSSTFGVLAKFQGCVACVLECVVRVERHLRLLNTVQHTQACQNLNWHKFTVIILSSWRRRIFLKSGPTGMATSVSNFQAHWTAVDKDLSKLEKYTLIPGLSMNFFFGFNDAESVRKISSGDASPGESFPLWVVSNPHPPDCCLQSPVCCSIGICAEALFSDRSSI